MVILLCYYYYHYNSIIASSPVDPGNCGRRAFHRPFVGRFFFSLCVLFFYCFQVTTLRAHTESTPHDRTFDWPAACKYKRSCFYFQRTGAAGPRYACRPPTRRSVPRERSPETTILLVLSAYSLRLLYHKYIHIYIFIHLLLCVRVFSCPIVFTVCHLAGRAFYRRSFAKCRMR